MTHTDLQGLLEGATDPHCLCCCRPLSEHNHKRQCPETTYFIENTGALLAASSVEREAGLPKVEFYQHDWIPAFAAFLPDASDLTPGAKAFCVLNLSAFLGAVDVGDLDASDLPYLMAESMMHEIIHVLEQWASFEFSEERVEALLTKYRDATPATVEEPKV